MFRPIFQGLLFRAVFKGLGFRVGAPKNGVFLGKRVAATAYEHSCVQSMPKRISDRSYMRFDAELAP